MKVVFSAAEVAPFVKTGGLADVAGSLPPALSAIGCEAIVVLPLYGSIKTDGLKKTAIAIAANMGNSTYQATVYKGRLGSRTSVYFISQHGLYSRPNPYGDQNGDYPDNALRFIFLNLAVLELLRQLKFRPDIIHVNDWHVALVPALLKNLPKADYLYGVRSVLSLHNLAYQGHFPPETMELTGLPASLLTADGVEMYGMLAFLKSGILFADALTAVSPSYAKEILSPELGFGLEKVLGKRKKSLAGILNGIDHDEWNPQKDQLIPAKFSRKDLSGKEKCRAALLKRFGLENDPKKPVIGIVSRLIEQKGFDLVAEVAEEMMKLDFYLVALGTGQPKYEEFFKALQAAHQDRVAVEIGYNNALTHLIEAGADMFLMPSVFEPCGMNQMYSMAYGTPPIVRATGGLKDSVEDWRPATGKGTGFVFDKADAKSLLAAVKRALKTFGKKAEWEKLVENGMAKDFSWKKSAELYLQLYKKVIA